MVSFPGARFAWSALAFLMALGAAPKANVDWSLYMHPHQMVDVGGRRINLYCTGSGSPAVLLGSDGDDATIGWRFVQPAIARRTRVCSYDGPGIGFSDVAPAPRDAAAQVRELRALLQSAGIATPIVLVGYGNSGLSARLYADRFPREVAGMVLVNPTVPYQHRLMADVIPSLADPLSQVDSFDRQCAAAAQRGAMQPGSPAFDQCMYAPPGTDLPASMTALTQRQWQNPGTWRDLTWNDEAEAAAGSAEVMREQRPYGDMPLIVLTSDVYAEHLPFPAAQQRALAAAWKRWRDEIAALSSRGVNFVVSGATTNVAIDRPADIVSAIDEVVYQVRARN